MAGERIRNLQMERPSAGKTPDETRSQDAIERSIRNAQPERSRGEQLAKDVSFTSGVTSYVAHNLGRPHKGWFVVHVRVANANIFEIGTTHADWSATRANTHVQLRAGATFIADVVVY
jgi:hypothetical protein